MSSLKKRRLSRKERRAKKLKNFFLLFSAAALSGVVFSLAAASCWHLVSSFETFTVKQINIHGAAVVGSADILSGSSIATGARILTVNLAEESRRVEQNPWIYRAVINRRLPDTIDITVFERTAAAVIKLDGYHLVDTRGNIFKQADGLKDVYPLITGLDTDVVEQHPESFFRAVQAALSLIREVQAADIFKGGNFRVEAGHPLGLTILRDEGTRAFFGWDGYEAKVVFVGKIINDLENKGIAAKHINVSSRKRAYVTL